MIGRRWIAGVACMLAAPIAEFTDAAGQIAVPSSEAAPSPEADEIVVTAYSKPHKLTGKRLQDAAQTFAKNKRALAPDANLYFEIKRKSGARDLGGLKLFLRSDGRTISLPIDAANRFVLPAFRGDGWSLVGNRGSGGLTITPLVLSPGMSEIDRRLGDARLECEVVWAAFLKPDLPLSAGAAGMLAPVCRTPHFSIYLSNGRKIANGTIANGAVMAGAVQTPLILSADRMSWRFPASVGTPAHAARLRIVYE